MRSSRRLRTAGLLLCWVFVGACERPDRPAPSDAAAPAAAAAVTQWPQQVYWGDLHLHSRYSFDAYSFGNTTLSPDDAYRFAKGETVTASSGQPARLARPLDFLAVTDHAEFLGVLAAIDDGDAAIAATDLGRRWRGWLDDGHIIAVLNEYIDYVNLVREPPDDVSRAFLNGIWRDIAASADRHNEPGRFTAFIGYEWTSMIDGDNLHRVVLFRDGANTVGDSVPFSALDSRDPEDLWAALAAYEAGSGGRALAIPHNGNLSDGAMFAAQTLAGRRFDRRYAEVRQRFEPVVEVTQVKGDGEAHPLLSPGDAFADFENWDEYDVNYNAKPAAGKAAMYAGEYARAALKRGLAFDRELGANPYRFGLIGSTDAHTALATADDGNYFGKFLDSEPTPVRLTNSMGGALWPNRRLAAAGYAAIWAEENTREALFDAILRREVYATTGPRIVLRLFAGYDFEPSLLRAPDLALQGYRRGVPMGGQLPPAPPGVAPTLVITAARDPAGANLDRVQVIKGWLQNDGTARERVFDVAWAGEREPDGDSGDLPAIGSTVDRVTATYTNSIGAEELAVVWRDPDFDPETRCFYYVRVLEIPTPRWTTHDAVRFGLELPGDVPVEVQQRAYSSPVWYVPGAAEPR